MNTWKNSSDSDKLMYQVVATALRSQPRLLKFIFDPLVAKVNFTAQTLPQALSGLSHGENVLTRVALDLWNSSGDAKLGEILEVLGSKDQANLLDALYMKGVLNLHVPDWTKEQLF